MAVRLPANGSALKPGDQFDGQVHLVCYSDASHAPLRVTKRRGISGGVLSVFGSVVKTLSRHQQMISLSSMESELFALQHVAQEMSSLGRIVARVLRSFGETSLQEIPGVLFSDSKSSLKLLRNMDVPRRSRHLEIRIEWLKGRVEDNKLILEFRKGCDNPSDLLTKCLGSAAFGYHRDSLGFEVMSGPIYTLSDLGRAFMFVEICCSENSSIYRVCKKLGIHYVGVTERMEYDSTFRKVKEHVESMNVKTFVHVSSPCSSGSPLKRFGDGEPKDSDWEWYALFPKVERYLKLGDANSFELPWNNDIWNFALCQKTLKNAGHNYHTKVRLCKTGFVTKDGKPVGKCLGFSSNSKVFIETLKRFSTCDCSEHASFEEVVWSETAFYTEFLAKAMIQGAKRALRA